MRTVERTARTVEEAINEALVALGADRSAVDIEVLEEGSKGLLGIFGSRLARVRVTLKSEPVVATEGSASAPVDAVREISLGEEDTADDLPDVRLMTRDEALEKACDFVAGIAKRLGLEVGIETREGEDGIVHINITGSNVGLIIGHHGQTLDAIQYLTNVVANQSTKERMRLVLDAEGYRVRREVTLTNLAQRMAGKAVAQRRRAVLEPMSALERRVIHLALQDSDEVTTYSEGEEPYRRVVIAPK